MQAVFGQALSSEDAAFFSDFFMEKLNDNAMVVTAPVHSQPPPSLEPGQSSDGTSTTATHSVVAQAAMEAEATAYFKATENIQDISDDDYVPCDDDLCSTDESIGDDDMEARQASVKQDEKVYVRRITRKSRKRNQLRKSNNLQLSKQRTKTTKPKPPQPKPKSNHKVPPHTQTC